MERPNHLKVEQKSAASKATSLAIVIAIHVAGIAALVAALSSGALQKQLADAFAEHIVGTFSLADQTLRYVRREWLVGDRKKLARLITDDIDELSRVFKQISIADEHGAIKLTSVPVAPEELKKIFLQTDK